MYFLYYYFYDVFLYVFSLWYETLVFGLYGVLLLVLCVFDLCTDLWLLFFMLSFCLSILFTRFYGFFYVYMIFLDTCVHNHFFVWNDVYFCAVWLFYALYIGNCVHGLYAFLHVYDSKEPVLDAKVYNKTDNVSTCNGNDTPDSILVAKID